MSVINYEGINGAGEKIKGAYYGTEAALAQEMKQQGIIITSVNTTVKKSKKKFNHRIFSQNIEEIYYLLTAGMNLDETLKTVIKNTDNPQAGELWQITLNYLKQGKSFSIALKEAAEEQHITIEDFYINILSVGEEIGDIAKSLKTIIEHMEFKSKINSEIRSAMAYPSFLIGVSVLSVFFISVFILPRFSSIFTESEMEQLPGISKVIILSGKFLSENLDLFLGANLILVSILFFAFKSPQIRKQVIKTISSFPIARDVLLYVDLSNTFSSMSTMLAGGVEITKAIALTEKSTGNPGLIGLLQQTQTEIKKGRKISEIWSTNSIIPNEVTALITVGERSARLPDIFDSLGKKYLSYFKESVSKFLVILEPAIIVLLGIFIAIIVIAIMLAVMSLSDMSI